MTEEGYIDFGFKTAIPNLFQNEKIYFHFLVALKKIILKPEDPKYWDISTWLAVDWHKDALDRYWQLQF